MVMHGGWDVPHRKDEDTMQPDMTKELSLYQLWCENASEDPDLVRELEEIRGDADAIRERFYCDLEFGTGGLRGVLGAVLPFASYSYLKNAVSRMLVFAPLRTTLVTWDMRPEV